MGLVTSNTIKNCFAKTKIIRDAESISKTAVLRDQNEVILKNIFAENNINLLDFIEYVDAYKDEEIGKYFTEGDILDMVNKEESLECEEPYADKHVKEMIKPSLPKKNSIKEVLNAILVIEEHLNDADILDNREDLNFKSKLYCLLNGYKNMLTKRISARGRHLKITDFMNR